MTRAASSKGILPYQHITQLIARKSITSEHPIENRQIQQASLN